MGRLREYSRPACSYLLEMCLDLITINMRLSCGFTTSYLVIDMYQTCPCVENMLRCPAGGGIGLNDAERRPEHLIVRRLAHSPQDPRGQVLWCKLQDMKADINGCVRVHGMRQRVTCNLARGKGGRDDCSDPAL